MILKKSLLATSILVATLGLTACGGSSSSSDDTVTTPTTPTTPTTDTSKPEITVTNLKLTEDTLGAMVEGFSATDNVAITEISVNDGRFELVDNQLKLKAENAINFEQVEGGKLTVTITAKDAAGNEQTVDAEIAITDVPLTAGVNYFSFNNPEGNSSVAYTGQTSRHAAITHVKNLIGALNEDTVGAAANQKTAAVAMQEIRQYLFPEDGSHLDTPLNFLGSFDAQQTTLSQISSGTKSVVGKIAGNDATYMHKTWNDGESFEGWTEFGSREKTPEGLVHYYLDLLEAQLVQKEAGTALTASHNGHSVTLKNLYVTPEGLDLKQLVQKHLNGAVALSQGADDYMDDLLIGDKAATNIFEAGSSYTEMEHKYDEGFGYFGAARDALEYSDSAAAGKSDNAAYAGGAYDTNGDGKIDLAAEYMLGNSTNAAKRDLNTVGRAAPTDFTHAANIAFIAGRKIINDNIGTEIAQWSQEDQDNLKKYRDMALLNWEKSIAATVVHYINDTIDDSDGDIHDIAKTQFTAEQFYAVAKHWSEMKGFALNLQFNPFSPVTDEKFKELHTLMGDKPVLTAEGVDAYEKALLDARAILAEAYGFDAENVANW